MNYRTTLKCAAFAAAIAMAVPAVAQNSSVKDLADMASAAMDAVRERNEQAASPEAVKAIFAKAEDAAEDGTINFCGFYLGMSEADARTLVSHYGLKDGQWTLIADPSTMEICQLSFTLRSTRRITKGGDSFDELTQAVANRIGSMKAKRNSDHDLIGYEYTNIDGQTGFMSEKGGLVLTDPGLMRKSALARLSSEMVPIPGKDYAMCKYEVTQALWEAVMGANPSKFKGMDLPVETVSWDDCQKFLEKLNARPEVKASGRTYRLPTKDEWKYACRAGATGDYCKLADGTEITRETLGEVAWYDDNSNKSTHSVGQKKPNAFGLYDMYGNVKEWTATSHSFVEGLRVHCGGSFYYHPMLDPEEVKYCQWNDCGSRDTGCFYCGFRLASDK